MSEVKCVRCQEIVTKPDSVFVDWADQFYCMDCAEFLQYVEKVPNSDSYRVKTKPSFAEKVVFTYDEARNLLLSKHKDYGPSNIANAPGGPLNGLRVRIHDKTARINHLIDNSKYKNPEHESLRDSFIDLMNYAAIALLVIDNKWPMTGDDSGADCE